MLNFTNNNASAASAAITLEQLNREAEQRRRNADLDKLNLFIITVTGVAGLFFTFAG